MVGFRAQGGEELVSCNNNNNNNNSKDQSGK